MNNFSLAIFILLVIQNTSPVLGIDKSFTIDSYPEQKAIAAYFENFEILAKSEKWEELISQGIATLKIAKATGRATDEAKICAQLTSTAFYLGDYPEALKYASRCHELSQEFTDSTLFIRALYLESAIYRALAGKSPHEHDSKQFYELAVATAEKAIHIYTDQAVNHENLKGKVYFNLGAAHADNPKGDLEKAITCYITALDCFKNMNTNDDLIRTRIRLGKVYLLQQNYDLSQEIINEIRPQLSSERLAMHTDYLEAQLKFALNDFLGALKITNHGLARAKTLGAKEDELRLISLIETIKFQIFTNKKELCAK